MSVPIPEKRHRRLRRTKALRSLTAENRLHVDDLIYPIFVEEDADERAPIASLPGLYRETEDSLPAAVKAAHDLGIKGFILFGVSHHKDDEGRDSLSHKGLLARMISAAKQAVPDAAIIADLCFCEYTEHGHCGPLDQDGDVDNDATLENLARQAVVAAKAGADIVAPSGMMDGMVAAIRHGLDADGFSHIPIMSYAAKYASCFYGPFRDAAGCGLGKGNRKAYQMNPANSREALSEVWQDVEEGADMVMVKPGMPYLDIISKVREEIELPVAAYQVSGEYAMIKAAASQGMLNEEEAMMESLLAFKRAGADLILTYFAPQAAKILNG